MKKITVQILFGVFTLLILILTFLFLRDFGYLNNWNAPIDSNKFADWGSLISGIMATGAFIFAFYTFINQANNSAKQEVENNYFKLIESLQFTVNQTTLNVPLDSEILIADENDQIKWKAKDKRTEIITGRNALRIILLRLLKDLKTTTIEDLFSESTDGEKDEQNYQKFYDNYFHILGHYFRYLYNIIKYIDSSDLSTKEKQRLVDLLQAHLSSDEMGLIFYNAIFNDKAKKKITGEREFHNLLEKYKLLENIDNNSLSEESHKTTYYPITFE